MSTNITTVHYLGAEIAPEDEAQREGDDEQEGQLVDGHPACECGRAQHLCRMHENPDDGQHGDVA